MMELYRAGSRPTSGFWPRHGRSARLFPPDTASCSMNILPDRLIRGKLLPEIPDQLGDLAVGQAVLEGRHIAKVGHGRLGDAVENDLDQIVRHAAVQIAVERE